MCQSRQILIFSLFLTVITGLSSFGQNKGGFVTINTINASGEVISVFEGRNKIALVKITQADTAKADFQITDSEVLCTFEFGTQPTTVDPKLPGVKAGDKILMEFAATRDRESDPWSYRVFRYWPIKEISSSPKDEKSQK